MAGTLPLGSWNRRDTCRGCLAADWQLVYDFGPMPLAGGFLLPEEREKDRVYPLSLWRCRACGLLQVRDVVDPRVLFDDYRYLSSVTRTLRAHFDAYADFLARLLPPGATVVEFGCNDGVLLAPLAQRGIRAIGVDRAPNVVEVARSRGLDVRCAAFGEALARELRAELGPVALITASNVFAHIDDLDDVLRGVRALLAPDGRFVVEVHDQAALVRDRQWDTVYHEHLCYYSLGALRHLAGRFGLDLEEAYSLPMHGGALRAVFRSGATPGSGALAILALERDEGLDRGETFEELGQAIRDHVRRLGEFIDAQKGRLFAYGAAGRATILLNVLGLGPDRLAYVVDESPFRQGRLMPGVHVPIVGREAIESDPCDVGLITAWNYRDEIVAKEPAFRARGGRWIVPWPTPSEVEGA